MSDDRDLMLDDPARVEPLRRLAGVVVLFEPEADVPRNISTYVGDLDVLFVVDNTPQPDPELVAKFRQIPTVEYLWLGDNTGIASALNAGARLAFERGYSWALMMDQDSQAFTGMIAALRRCAASLTDAPAVVAAVAPANREVVGFGVSPVLVAITSGSLLDLTLWDSLGGFTEELFIDQVDHEFCLRCQSVGRRVYSCHEAILLHRLGRQTTHRWFGAAVVTANHSATRRYYMTRNTLFIGDLYAAAFPEWFRAEARVRRMEMLRMLLFESERAAKVGAVARAYRDHRRGLLGRSPDRPTPAAPVLARIRTRIAGLRP